jgi:lysozyme
MSEAGLAFLARHEGLRLHMYNDSQGHCTIGIGHLVHFGPINGTDPSEAPFANGITRDAAMDLFRTDVVRYATAVSNAVTTRLNQYYFDALVSFCYNIGIGGFQRSGVLRALNAWQYDQVPNAMLQWNRPPEIAGRRADEAQLFRTGQYQ